MKTTPWREIRDRRPMTPERAAGYVAEKRAIRVLLALADLRARRAVTQTALAEALDVTQSRISHLEQQDDLSLSTLDNYIRAMGGELRVTAVFPDETIDLMGARQG